MKKKYFFLLIVFAFGINCFGQSLVIASKYQAPSFEEMMLQAQVELIKKQRYDEWTGMAYEALENGDRETFLTYALYALETRWYSSKLYYDIGDTYEYFGDLKKARKYYRKAKRKGYRKAIPALERVKLKLKKR